MTKLRESSVPLRVEKKKENPKQQKQQCNRNENLERELALLEQEVEALDKKLVAIDDVLLLQQLYKEKEDLEKKWEELCDQLGN